MEVASTAVIHSPYRVKGHPRGEGGGTAGVRQQANCQVDTECLCSSMSWELYPEQARDGGGDGQEVLEEFKGLAGHHAR